MCTNAMEFQFVLLIYLQRTIKYFWSKIHENSNILLSFRVYRKLWFDIGIDANIEVIVVSLTTWEAHHSPKITF